MRAKHSRDSTMSDIITIRDYKTHGIAQKIQQLTFGLFAGKTSGMREMYGGGVWW